MRLQYVVSGGSRCVHFSKVPLAIEGRTLLGADPIRKGSVAVTCAYTLAIDRSSRAGHRSILVLTSFANTRAGQSGRLSGDHA